MKIKKDFVTNSSSCAFVFIGWKLDETMENAMRIANLYNINTQVTDNPLELMEEIGSQHGLDIYFGDLIEEGFNNGFIYIGSTYDIDETDDSNEIGLIESFSDELVDEFGVENIKIITSVRMC